MLAVGLLALSYAMAAFMWLSLVLPGWEQLPGRPSDLADALLIVVSMAAIITLPTSGAVLAILRPHNPIGWLLIIGGLGVVFGFFAPEYVQRSVILGSELPGYRLLDWLYPVQQALGFYVLVFWVPLLFPDGPLPGARWRVVVWVAAIVTGASFVLGFLSVAQETFERQLPNPTAVGGNAAEIVRVAIDVTNVLSLALILLAMVSVVIRFRRSRGVERQQMKWFLAGASLVFVAIMLLALWQSALAFYGFMAAVAFLPIAIGIAVLRYRLYEIDRIISRTIGWAVVTGLLVGAFALLVLGSSAVLEPLTGGNTLAVAGSTLVVALLFNPVRSRVQRAVDRRFDRSRYDGERTLAAFGERLRDEVDLTTIRADVLGTVETSVRPTRVGLWLRRPEGEA